MKRAAKGTHKRDLFVQLREGMTALAEARKASRRRESAGTTKPLGDLKVVPDFLPRPENLVFRDERLLNAYAKRQAKRSPARRSMRTRRKASRAN